MSMKSLSLAGIGLPTGSVGTNLNNAVGGLMSSAATARATSSPQRGPMTSTGAAIPAALALVDFAPQQTLGLLMPMVAQKVKGSYGVDLDYQITEAPPAAPGDKPQKAGGMSGKAVVLGVLVGLGGAFAGSHFGVVGAGKNLLHRVGL